MIHTLAKKYGITRHDAEKYREIDFWEMLGFENLESAKEEYLMKENING